MCLAVLVHYAPMPVMLGPHSNSSDVLLLFSRFKDEKKRLTLEQNPQFYESLLYTRPEEYTDEIQMDPIESFQNWQISVLIDNPGHAGRVFLETAGNVRTFGNVWYADNIIIFKGSCLLCFYSLTDTLLDVRGRLEGEHVVGAAIECIPDLWCFEEPSLSVASQSALSLNRNGRSPTVTATQITSAEGRLIGDWRGPICRMLQSRDVNIRITDRVTDKTPSFRSIYSAASSGVGGLLSDRDSWRLPDSSSPP
jgi:hypothetical protein